MREKSSGDRALLDQRAVGLDPQGVHHEVGRLPSIAEGSERNLHVVVLVDPAAVGECGSHPIGRLVRPDAEADECGQYTSEASQRVLQGLGVICSMSRSGNVWDNAAMESFFSTPKTERCRRRHYSTRDAARADVFNYIEQFYNSTRRHSTPGNVSPMAFERAMAVA